MSLPLELEEELDELEELLEEELDDPEAFFSFEVFDALKLEDEVDETELKD